MRELGAVTYLLFAVYVANSLMLSAVAAKQAGRPPWRVGTGQPLQRLSDWTLRIAFAAALAWPPLRMWTGGLASDPLTGIFAGMSGSLSGHLLVALGAAVALISQYHLGSARRSAAESGQSGLVQNGPFAVSRNPILIGRMVMFAGLFLAFPDLVQGLISASVLVAAIVQVRVEEYVLKATFGAAYDAYAARVPRWTGWIRW
jgi:protein-S-isoprenylcysteine O-methyltransferase Ste14